MAKGDYYFDAAAADHVCEFFETLLVHTQGEHAGKPFLLLDWQREILREVYGWKRKSNGLRRYSTVYVSVPKGTGKSEVGGGLALYHLVADGEQEAEVYSAAGDRLQASICFKRAKQMVLASPELAKRIEIYTNSLYYPPTRSTYTALSAIAATKHGYAPSAVIFDELHVQKTRDLWDTLTMGLGKRAQPMLFVITTAGEEEEGSIYCEIDDYAQQVQADPAMDESWFVYIRRASKKLNWSSEKAWKEANPSYGITVKKEFLEKEARLARSSPARLASFRRLYLNQRVQAVNRWIAPEAWAQCAGELDFRALEEELAGRECYGGLDLASKTDLTALVLCFPPENTDTGTYDFLSYFWTPEQRIFEQERGTQVSFSTWNALGLLYATPGEVIDHASIRLRLTGRCEGDPVVDEMPLAERYRIREIAFDRYGSDLLRPQLEGDGLTMIQFGQGWRSMSEPTKELQRLVLAGRIRHGGHPVLRWNISCLDVAVTTTGGVSPKKPDARKSSKRIDGAVAAIMALSRAQANANGSSVYEREERGVMVL